MTRKQTQTNEIYIGREATEPAPGDEIIIVDYFTREEFVAVVTQYDPAERMAKVRVIK